MLLLSLSAYCSKISLESVLEKWDLQDEALRHNQEYLESVYTQRCVLLRLCGERRGLQGLQLQRAHMNHLERLVHWARNIGAHQVTLFVQSDWISMTVWVRDLQKTRFKTVLSHLKTNLALINWIAWNKLRM